MRYAYNAYKSYTQNKSNKVTTGVGISSQHDVKTIYRKKRMPRRKRKAWARFSKKVTAVLDKSVGTKTLVINNVDALVGAIGLQSVSSYLLYGMNGQNGTGTRGNSDLITIASNFTNAKKVVYKSGIMDLTITNTNATANQEVDIYHVRFNNEHEANTPLATFANAVANTVVTTGRSTLTIQARGATPWDFPLALSVARITIVKKTKVFISAGNSTTYQIRDPRNFQISKYDINNQTPNYNYVKPGMTQGVIIIAKNVAGFQGVATNLSVGCTQKYVYGEIQDSVCETGIV